MLVEKITHESEDIVFVYTTCSDAHEARSIGLAAIGQKLAISADYWTISSMYPWRGVIQDVDQHMLMLTTERKLADKLITFIGGMHSYTTPMIAQLDTKLVNPPYAFWVADTLSDTKPYLSEEEARIIEQDQKDDGYHYGRLK